MKRPADFEIEEGEIATTASPMTRQERQVYDFKNFTARKRSPSPLYYEPVYKTDIVEALRDRMGGLDAVLDACDLCRRACGRDVLWRALCVDMDAGCLRRIRPGSELFDFLACASIASKWYCRDNVQIFDDVTPDIGVYYDDGDVSRAEISVLRAVRWVPFPIETIG